MVVPGVYGPPAAELFSAGGIAVEVTPLGDYGIVHITTPRAKTMAAFLSLRKATSVPSPLVYTFVPVYDGKFLTQFRDGALRKCVLAWYVWKTRPAL